MNINEIQQTKYLLKHMLNTIKVYRTDIEREAHT